MSENGGAEEGLEMVVAALERGQMKQPRLDLPASVVMVVRIAVVRNTGPVAVVVVVRIAVVLNTGPLAMVVVLPRAKAPAAWAAVAATVVVVIVFLQGAVWTMPSSVVVIVLLPRAKAPAARAKAVAVVVLLEGAARTMPSSAARPCESAPAGPVKVPQAAGRSRSSERSCRSPQSRGSRCRQRCTASSPARC